MKKLAPLLITMLMPALSWAMDLGTLEKAQTQLQAQYDLTRKTTGSPSQVIQALTLKDHHSVVNSLNAIERFMIRYDQFNLTKIDYFMSQTKLDLRRKFTLALPKISKHKNIKLTKKLNAIDIHYANYQNRKKNLGKMDDYKRIEAGRDFFIGSGEFANELRVATGGKANRVWGSKLLPFVDNLKEFAPVADDFIHLLYSSYFRTHTKKPNQTPIVDALRTISQEVAKDKNTRTKWNGLKNLQAMPLDGKTINIFTFMHANSYFDTAIQGTLRLDGLSTITNVDVIFPKFLAKQMIKSDHIITVGHGDMLAKVENLARSKKLNKFFIAAEGLTPVGFYEMRPLVDFYAESIYSLIDRGMRMNVYPVSFPDNFRFMNDYRRPVEGNKLVTGMIHPHLNTESLQDLRSMTGDVQSMSHLIRWIWFADLKNTSALNMGMPKPTQMKTWLDGMLWGNL
jgi:hypothetical protein